MGTPTKEEQQTLPAIVLSLHHTTIIMSNMEEKSKQPKHVVIVGAGPAGLLAAILLLRRNSSCLQKYQVTLIDPGVNYGKLDEEGLKRFRSWMIGLTCHGLDAIKTVPGLYQDYIKNLGINLTNAVYGIGSSLKFNVALSEQDQDNAFLVDRNYICGALAKYLEEQQYSTSAFQPMYETTALYVDSATKQVLIRSKDTTERMAISYDILLGCDGIRSIVRNAFLTHHRDFEFDMMGDFGIGKSVHITLPQDVNEGTFMFLANCLPNVSAFILPERGGMLNFACGYNLNQQCDEELYSNDPKVISDYFKTNFKAFKLDCDEMANEWVKQDWVTGQMVHCNFYHSLKIQALLLGDAAHATVPNIGQGMNTALADAAVLNDLLDEYKDDWEQVLPAFSELRVKEGNALTDLSYHSFSLSPAMQMSIMWKQNTRRFFNKYLPEWLVAREPMLEITQGMKLSQAYDEMMQLGYLQKSRRINLEIMQAHFEKTTGMGLEWSRNVRVVLVGCQSCLWWV